MSQAVPKCPYAKLDNPQSLNLYAYVLNNPVSSVDPDGHVDDGGDGPIDRVIIGAEGVFNLAVGAVEAGEAAGSTALAPETFGASLAGTAYFGVRAAGSITAGGAQIIGAVTGHVKEGARAAAVAGAVTTVTGATTLSATHGDLDKASKVSAIEGVVTINPKELSEGAKVVTLIKKADAGKAINEGASVVQPRQEQKSTSTCSGNGQSNCPH